jgi:hypothetical protein
MALSAADVGERAAAAAVRVDTETAFGSGVVVRQDGWIATSYHIVEGARSVTVTLDSGQRLDVDSVKLAPELGDIALVHVAATALRALPLAGDVPSRRGERVIVLGNPKGFSYTLSDGLYNGLRHVDGHELVQFSAPISSGSSGGPVLNERAEVIGIVSRSRNDGENLSFAVPSPIVRQLLASGNAPLPTSELATRAADGCLGFGLPQCRLNCFEADDAKSCLALAQQALRDDDYPEATASLRRGCELGQRMGCTFLATTQVELAPRDQEVARTARQTLSRLCNEGEPSACKMLPALAKLVKSTTPVRSAKAAAGGASPGAAATNP